MTKKKYCYEFTEYRQYKCCLCGRTMHEPTPHICNGQYRKHNLIFIKKDEEIGTTKEECNMTKEEIKKFLDNTKVYVNGKSEEIQKKLFSLGYYWYNEKLQKVMLTEMPFLFIESDEITSSCDMRFFNNNNFTEITAEQILSLELTEGYRPFKDKNECWNEMLKHQPFGWIKSKDSGNFILIGFVQWYSYFEDVMVTFAATEQIARSASGLFKRYTFADGTPFGIKE